MYFGFACRAIRQDNPRQPFQLPPPSLPIKLPKSRDFPNSASHRDRFSTGDLAHNTKTHDKLIVAAGRREGGPLPQVELLHLVAQRVAGDAQQARGLRLVAVGLLQSAGQQAPLVVLERKPVGGNVHARGHR